MKNKHNKQVTIEVGLDQLIVPKLFQVRIHNDDFTPMEFVAESLEHFFNMERHQAVEIMMEAHLKGVAICGAYTRDLADTIISQAEKLARENDYPLLYSMEAI